MVRIPVSITVKREDTTGKIVPSMPDNFDIIRETITSTSVQLTYDAAQVPGGGPPVNGYAIFMNNEHIKTVPATMLKPVITGLFPEHTYVAQVAAVNEDGMSVRTTGVSFGTLSSGVLPPPPTGLAVTPLSSTSGSVSWVAPVSGGPFDQWRSGTWWKKPLPNPLPAGTVHTSNTSYLNALATGASTYSSFRLINGVGNAGDFATPVGWVSPTASAPTYQVITNVSAMVGTGGIDALDTGGPGADVFPDRMVAIPATLRAAFTPDAANAGSDRELLIINRIAGYSANLSKAYYFPAGTNIPGVGTSPSPNGAWSCKGSQIAYFSSYGFDYTGRNVWPTALQKYADDSRNQGNHRGNNPSFRVVRWDEYKDGPLVAHPLEMYAALAGSNALGIHFPMTGTEDKSGAVVPEGLRVHIKWSVDLAAKLNWIIAAHGQAAYDQALMIAKTLQTYGFYVGDNSGGANAIKLEGNQKESNKAARLWTVPEDAFKNFAMATDFESIKFDYDPATTDPGAGTVTTIDGYRVFVNGVKYGADLPSDARSLTLTGLPGNSNPSITVRSFNEFGQSVEAGPIIMRLQGTTTTPRFAGHIPNRVLVGIVAPDTGTSRPLYSTAGPSPWGDARAIIGKPNYIRRVYTPDPPTAATMTGLRADMNAVSLIGVLSAKVTPTVMQGIWQGTQDALLQNIYDAAVAQRALMPGKKPFLMTLNHEPYNSAFTLADWSRMQQYCSQWFAGYRRTSPTAPWVYGAARDVSDVMTWCAIHNGWLWGPNPANYNPTAIDASYSQTLIDIFKQNGSVLCVDSYDPSPPNGTVASMDDPSLDRASEKIQSFIDWARSKNSGMLGVTEMATVAAPELTRVWQVARQNRDILAILLHWSSNNNSRWEWRLIPDAYPVTSGIALPDYLPGQYKEIGGTPVTEARMNTWKTICDESISPTYTAPL